MAFLRDGHPTTITFSENPNILLQEKTVKPPAVIGGGAIDTKNMRRTKWRTKWPKTLKEMGDITGTSIYDPAVYPQLIAMVNVNQELAIEWADGQILTVWGWLDNADPSTNEEGEEPTIDFTVILSMMDNSGNEVDPVLS